MFTFRQRFRQRSSHSFCDKLTPAPIREGKSYVALTGKSLGTPGLSSACRVPVKLCCPGSCRQLSWEWRRNRGRRPANRTHILLGPARLPAVERRQGGDGVAVELNEGLIGGAEYFLCALSQCSRLALTFIPGADSLAVIYRVSCWQGQAFHCCWAQQETLVYSKSHWVRGGNRYLFSSCV